MDKNIITEPFLLDMGEGSALFLGDEVGVDFGVVLLTSSVDPQLVLIIAFWSPVAEAWISEVIARALLLLLPDEFRVKFPSPLPLSLPKMF